MRASKTKAPFSFSLTFDGVAPRLRGSLRNLFAVGALLSAGCTTPYVLLHEASPNPFDGYGEFVVLPVDYTNLAPSAPAAGGTALNQGAAAGVNDQFQTSLRKTLADNGIDVDPPGTAGVYVLRPRVQRMDSGGEQAIPGGTSRLEMSVAITDPSGAVLDEIQIAHGTDPGSSADGTARLRADADAIGVTVGVYVRDRTGDYDNNDQTRRRHHLH
jgi:hypothetical protein